VTQYNIGFDPTQPTQIVFAAAAKPAGRRIAEQTIYNRDPAIPLLIAFEDPHQQPDFTGNRTSVVDPLSSTVVNGTVDVWAVGNPGSIGAPAGALITPNQPAQPPVTGQTVIIVDVIPTGLGASGNPLAIAVAIVQSGLALAIAQQIATSGISLIGAPQLLYNTQISGAAGTPGGWGSTIPAGAPPLYGLANNDFTDARTDFDNLIGTPSGAAKIFMGNKPGNLPTTPNAQMSAAIAAGLRIYLGYKPAFNPPTAAEQTALVASINAMKAACTAAGTGASVVAVFLWNEVNGQAVNNNVTPPTASQYATCVNFYGAAITGTGVQLGHVAIGGKANWSTYFSAGSFTAGLISWIGVDYYATAFNNNVVLDGAGANNINTIAAGYTPPLSVAMPEMGSTALSTVPSNQVVTNYLAYCQKFLTARIIAGLVNLDCIWFDGPGTGNCIFSGNDFRIPLLQKFIPAVTTVPQTGIAAGATAVVQALNPSPIAGYATAPGLSYDVTFNLIAGAASTKPFAEVTLQWFNSDSTTATPVATQVWVLPMGTNGTLGTYITGIGPQHGQFLQVSITNLDTVSCAAVVQLNSAGRPVDRHKWIWDAVSSVTVPTFTLPGTGAPYANSLVSLSNSSVPASGSITRICGMFAGEAFFRCNDPTGKLQFVLSPVPGSLWGSSALVNETPGGEFAELLILPRGLTTITVSNSDAAAAHPANAELVALD